MKIGQMVNTKDGKGIIIENIGKHPLGKPYLIRLNKKIGIYDQFYYSKKELKLL